MVSDFPQYPDQLRQHVVEVRPKIPDGHHSMSEREWGQVMRKLEKGEAPDLVRSWLAQQAESRGKPRPDDYAKRTVENAIRQFQNRPARSWTEALGLWCNNAWMVIRQDAPVRFGRGAVQRADIWTDRS